MLRKKWITFWVVWAHGLAFTLRMLAVVPRILRQQNFHPLHPPTQYFMHVHGLQDAAQEAACYVLLKPLQGSAIPTLFGISSLTVPGTGPLVLELIEGTPYFVRP